MKLPFHAVEVRGGILFAARGASIHSFNLADGSHISCSWKFPAAEVNKTAAPRKEDQLVINVSENSTPAPSQDEQGPPAKRVKLDSGETQADNETPSLRGGGSGGKKNKKQGPKPGSLSQTTERSMVILMTITQDGQHVVAVTSDKSIWVLEHDGQGQLKQLSRRTMPKRPCSVIITPDNQDILTADKFGDVYSIPLIQSPDWKPTTTITAPSDTSPAEAGAPSPSPSLSPSPAPTLAATATTGDVKPQYYKPQATELTVHTGRNRKALLDQQISASHAKVQGQGGTPRRVETAPFERYLLLGHVSLLTAVAYGFDDDDVDNIDNNENGRRMGRRPYILTADRDEHIRVSRGTRAQAHVIEQFCLGHVDFVNRLCIPSSSHGGNNNNNNDKHRNGNGNADPLGHLLVSAGGDPELFVWRWKEGRLLAKAPLLAAVQAVVPEATKVAVTGLCEWPFAMAAEQAEAKDGEKKETRTRMVAICERVPAIFVYHLHASGVLEPALTIALEGKPLDVAVLDSKNLIVALDMSFEQDSPIFVSSSLAVIGHDGETGTGTGKIKAAAAADLGDGESDATEAELQKLLYHAETLRKMESEDGGEAD